MRKQGFFNASTVGSWAAIVFFRIYRVFHLDNMDLNGQCREWMNRGSSGFWTIMKYWFESMWYFLQLLFVKFPVFIARVSSSIIRCVLIGYVSYPTKFSMLQILSTLIFPSRELTFSALRVSRLACFDLCNSENLSTGIFQQSIPVYSPTAFHWLHCRHCTGTGAVP